MEPDAELMWRVRMGDDTGFALLLDRYRAPVTRFLYRMVQNRSVAEELAQNVFLRAYRARASYEPTAKISSWLFCIASRQALNWRRDMRRQGAHESLDSAAPERPLLVIPDRRPNAEQVLVERSRIAEVRQAVEALPERQRAAVVLHKYHDMDYAEIAASLECSASAVKSLLFRAYENLRASLAHLDMGATERLRPAC
jgi:RNA polymerase sigma-70 factor (ECF subfamily)